MRSIQIVLSFLIYGFMCSVFCKLDIYSICQVEEVYNFCQDDLLTEDILILDTHAEVFIWVGQSVDSKDKQNTFEIGQVCSSSLYCSQK